MGCASDETNSKAELPDGEIAGRSKRRHPFARLLASASPRSRNCRHKAVTKASPCRRGPYTILARIGALNPCSLAQRAPGTTGSKDELRSRTDCRAHNSLAPAGLHRGQRLWLIMRPRRRLGGARVFSSAGRRSSHDLAEHLNSEAPLPRRSVTVREHRDVFSSGLSGQNSIRLRRPGSER